MRFQAALAVEMAGLTDALDVALVVASTAVLLVAEAGSATVEPRSRPHARQKPGAREQIWRFPEETVVLDQRFLGLLPQQLGPEG